MTFKSASCVYMVPCSRGKQYVGEMSAAIKTCIKQHQKAIFENKINGSTFAEQANIPRRYSSQGDVSNILFRRSVRESLEIQRQRTVPREGLNKDIGRYVKTNTWLPFL